MRKILPYLILLSALSVSLSAAYYSIFGLSKLFAGAATQVIIMASSLEVAKIIIATLLHQYWNQIKNWLKYYLLFSVIVLVFITSAGIYGFLSAAYQETANKDKIITRGIELIDTKKEIWENSKNDYLKEKERISNSIIELTNAVSSSNQTETIDRRTGQKITSKIYTNKSSLEKQLNKNISDRDILNSKISIATDSISKYEIQKVELINNSESTSELGPLKYLSKITNTDMDIVVNWFLLLIIFVFDPLALALIIAANFTFQLKSPNKSLPEEKIIEPAEIIEYSKPEKIVTIGNNNTKKTKIKKEKIDEMLDEVFPENNPEKKSLTPEQIRNMSHQTIKNYLK